AKCLGTMGTPAAFQSLKRLASHENPLVRRAVVGALGNFKDESVAKLLAGIISGDKEKSYFVLAEAATALGKTGSSQAYPALQAALNMSSWLETVRVGVLSGLAELGDERGVDHAIEYAAAGKPWHSRPAAISALGKFGAKATKALEALHNLADSQ